MKRLAAILLTLAMMTGSVCAMAETVPEQDAALNESAAELNDDADTEAEDTALQAEAEAYKAAEAESEGLAEKALDNDRMINAELNVTTAENFLPMLNGLNIKVSAQNNGVNYFRYDAACGENQYGGAIGYADDTLYVQLDALGDEMYALDTSELTSMADELLDFLDIDLQDFSLTDFMQANGMSDLSMGSLMNLDLTGLDLSPMLAAMMKLSSCVTIQDNENYQLTPEVIDPENTEVPDTTDQQNSNIAMTANVVVTRDDLSVLINCIAETIARNEDVFAVYGISAQDASLFLNQLADCFSEDIAATIGLDADGNFVYGSTDYSTQDVGSFRLQVYADRETDGTTYTANILMTTDDTDEYITVFSAKAALSANSVMIDVLQGDPEDTAAGFRFTGYVPYGEIKDYRAEFSTVIVENGVASYPFTAALGGTLETDGVDFTAKGYLTIDTDDANTNLLTADITVATAPAETIDLSNAVDLLNMDVDEDIDLIGEIFDIMEDIEE